MHLKKLTTGEEQSHTENMYQQSYTEENHSRIGIHEQTHQHRQSNSLQLLKSTQFCLPKVFYDLDFAVLQIQFINSSKYMRMQKLPPACISIKLTHLWLGSAKHAGKGKWTRTKYQYRTGTEPELGRVS